MLVCVVRLAKKVDSSLRKGGWLVAVSWACGSCCALPGSAAAAGLEAFRVGGGVIVGWEVTAHAEEGEGWGLRMGGEFGWLRRGIDGMVGA